MQSESLNFWPSARPWAELEADDYILPQHQIRDDADYVALAAHCTRALAAAAYNIWTSVDDEAAKTKIETLLSTISLEAALSLGAEVHGDWYAPRRSRLPAVLSRHVANQHAIDLEAIEVLDKLVAALKSRRGLDFDPLDLTRVAFHAALNPVSLCPQAFALSDLLTVSAWLGLLHRGRDVVMPGFVASYFLMLVEGGEGWPEAVWAPDAFLVEKAAAAMSMAELRRTISKVMEHGPTAVRRTVKC